ncbi:MAG: hypothetical protein ACJASQ_000093 [Crocinitomicaceae bacterium]|jgi:hypothetical protein
MTTKQRKRILYVLAILYLISFCLPVASSAEYSLEGTALGFYCAVYVVVLLVIDLDSGNIQAIFFDIFLILPNLLMILTLLFHEKFHPLLKYLFLLIVFLSAGSWIFTFQSYIYASSLKIGYWLWFISSTSYMLMVALPKEKKVDLP